MRAFAAERFPSVSNTVLMTVLPTLRGPVDREAQKRQPAPFMGLVVSPRAHVSLMSLRLGKRQPELPQTRCQQGPHRVHIGYCAKNRQRSSAYRTSAALPPNCGLIFRSNRRSTT